MTITECKKAISSILTDTRNTIMIGGTGSKYLCILKAITRRGYQRLYSIQYLMADLQNGDAILDLARSAFEEMISVEFIKNNGKDAVAEEVFEFMSVENWNDRQFLSANGIGTSDAGATNERADVPELLEKFTRKDGEIYHSWARCGIEDMIKTLVVAKIIAVADKEILLQGYIQANRKNHVSAIDILSYLDQPYRDANQENSARMGFNLVIICYVKVLSEYIEELNLMEEKANLKALIKSILPDMGSMLSD